MADEEQQPLIGLQKKLQEKKHTRKLRRLKYSCEEVYERMDNGLCIFCDELDTPGHHDLKHKGIQIFMVECDDGVSDYEEEAHQVHETLTNPAPIEESVYSDQICDEKELVSIDLDQQEVQTKTVTGEKLNLPNGQNVEHLVGKNFETFSTDYRSFLNLSSSEEYQKDSTWIESSLYLFFSLKDDRVWEPGGVPNKMDFWDRLEKELKSYGESHKVATFLYSQMQVVKSNLAAFKTFDRKRSNKTLSLDDERDDEHEQNQVIKLISSWTNRIWEPGGVSIEQDNWKWSEKCYEHKRVMRLIQGLSSTWWSYGKMAESTQELQRRKTYLKGIKLKELDRLAMCSCVAIKTWLELCSYEYKVDMLLLDYYGLEVQVLSCFKEECVIAKMNRRIVLCLQKLKSIWWFGYNEGVRVTSTKHELSNWSVTCSSVGCIVALLMVYDAERIQSDAPPIFSDLLCVKNRIQGRLKMVLLLEFLWLILFTSKMFKSSNVPQKRNQTDQKLSSYWKLLLSWKISQNIHVSSRCVLRQEESYVKVLELIKDRDSRKRKLCKNWWFKFKLNTWPSETLHLWRKRKSEKLQRASKHKICELVQKSWDMSIFGKSRTWLLCKMRILHDLKDLIQFTRAGIKFHLKHKWRSKFGSSKLTRTWTRQKGMAESSTKTSCKSIQSLILEDKNVSNGGVLLQEILSQPTIFLRFISTLLVYPITRFNNL